MEDHPYLMISGGFGKLLLILGNEKGKIVARAEQPFAMGALGDQTLQIPLTIPETAGKFRLKATAKPDGKDEATLSRRWVKVESR